MTYNVTFMHGLPCMLLCWCESVYRQTYLGGCYAKSEHLTLTVLWEGGGGGQMPEMLKLNLDACHWHGLPFPSCCMHKHAPLLSPPNLKCLPTPLRKARIFESVCCK